MPKLYGKEWSRDELRQHVGSFHQIAGCRRYELQEGFEKGVEVLDIRTGSGFRFCVSPSRGMDILFAEHNGRPLSWNSATGWPHPAYYEKSGLDWLRGFGGGLLVTCGLESFAGVNEDGIDTYGLHDRISYTPATRVKVEEGWTEAGEYEIAVEGILRQTRVFGTNLTLTRRIVARLGEDKLVVQDRLANEGFGPAPAVILYHCNFGFPVVSENSVVRAPSTERAPRDADAAANPDTWNQFDAPRPDWPERCYNHAMNPDSDGYVRAEIWNEELQFGGYIRYRANELPHFTQWQSMSCGDYVCGLEPSSAYLTSRADLRERGELPILQPGEVVEFEVELGAVLP